MSDWCSLRENQRHMVSVRPEKMKTNIIFTAVAYILTVVGFAAWVFKTKPERVPRNRRTIFALALRTAPLYLIVLYVCQSLGISVIAGVAILFACLVALCGPFFMSPTGLISIGFLYVMQQWILGWPDRALLVNDASLESNQTSSGAPDPLVGRTAQAATPLRPTGKVVVDGKELDASCEFGFLQAGSQVEIVGRRSFTLLVKPKDGEAEQSSRPVPK